MISTKGVCMDCRGTQKKVYAWGQTEKWIICHGERKPDRNVCILYCKFQTNRGTWYVEGMTNDSEGPGGKWLEMKVLK